METILHLLPLTGAQKAAFQAAAPESEHLFLPTNDRGGSQQHPPGVAGAHHHSAGLCPPEQLKTFPNLKWVQSWNAGVDPIWSPAFCRRACASPPPWEPTAQPCLNTCWPCSWPSISACPPTGTSRGPISGRILDPLAP